MVEPAVGTPLTIVTLSGEKWGKETKLIFQFDGDDVTTNPGTVITDENGRFEDVTFEIPSGTETDEMSVINITDERQSKQLKFAVVPFQKTFEVNGVLA